MASIFPDYGQAQINPLGHSRKVEKNQYCQRQQIQQC